MRNDINWCFGDNKVYIGNVSASNQPWQASAESPKGRIGSFLVMAYGSAWPLGSDGAECICSHQSLIGSKL